MQNWIPVWNKAPFIRLLAALIAGIVFQWQLQLSFITLLYLLSGTFVLTLLSQVLLIHIKFRLQALSGLFIHLLLVFTGALLVWLNDIRNNEHWFGAYYSGAEPTILRIEEPLIEKDNSYKALASVIGVYKKGKLQSTQGYSIIYFKKEVAAQNLGYGAVLTISKPLQPIKNAGNPGGFDYKRYCLFQNITHQVYLTSTEFQYQNITYTHAFQQFIYDCRSWVLSVLQTYIAGNKESGLAQALLIGYKDDLDKNLVQSYSNTGVVHVIAISGLHLGLIYWLLLLLTKPLHKKRYSRWFRLLLVVAGLWLFSILAGAQPSVVRSAVMFTVIAIGESLNKRGSIFNTLALSAFGLLCYNPFWLWDVGFQLSYAAVLSIVLFFQPVYNWFDFQNKAVDFIWKLNAVTISAQILTLPLSIYHFHQLPTLFLLTNLVAVPLSSIILLGEIGLCVLSFLPVIAKWLGIGLHKLIYLMNSYVERLDAVSFSVWNGLSINLPQLFLLIGAALAFCYWCMDRQKSLLWTFAICLLLFVSFRSYSFIQTQQQQKLIVYNVPKRKAIDLINGTTCAFVGDKELMLDDFTRNFHIQPSRTIHRIDSLHFEQRHLKNFSFAGRKVLLIDTLADVPGYHQSFDIVVLSKNPRLYIPKLVKQLNFRQLVIDGSVPQWKARLWKKDCTELGIPCHDVSDKGAYVLDL